MFCFLPRIVSSACPARSSDESDQSLAIPLTAPIRGPVFGRVRCCGTAAANVRCYAGNHDRRAAAAGPDVTSHGSALA